MKPPVSDSISSDASGYTPLFRTRLYSDGGGCFAVLGKAVSELPDDLPLETAVSSSVYCVTFVFWKDPPEIKTEDKAVEVVRAVDDTLSRVSPAVSRGIIWYNGDNAAILPLFPDETRMSKVFLQTITRNLEFEIYRSTVEYSLEKQGITFPGDPFLFTGVTCDIFDAYLPLLGDDAGVLKFQFRILFNNFVRGFNPGFEFSWTEDDKEKVLSFPLTEIDSNSISFLFDFSLCFSDITRSGMATTISEGNPAFLSFFTTIYGERISLTPQAGAGFAFSSSPVPSGSLICVPRGDFSLSTERGCNIRLLCGFYGSEYFDFPQGGKIGFVPENPVFATKFPSNELSISDFMDASTERIPLSGKHLGSWAVARGPASYFSQPTGDPFYGGSDPILMNASSSVMIDKDPAPFPLVPYAGIKPVSQTQGADYERYESQVISKTRSAVLGRSISSHPRGFTAALQGALAGDASRTVSSPSGYIVSVNENGAWDSVRLASCGGDTLEFDSPPDELVSAFMTPGLFLVAANKEHLGNLKSALNIGGFNFSFPVGTRNGYNNYRDILILKSSPGKLYDPEFPQKSLAANPVLWTSRDVFASPCTDGKISPAQQMNLANFLMGYFKNAYDRKDNPYFTRFAEYITDENWQGFLFLNVTLTHDNLPPDLNSICGALPKGSGITLHHFGGKLTPVKASATGPVANGDSALFGLIYFTADGYTGTAMPPDSNDEFEYKLDELKVLFENSAVAQFESASQLIFADFFGVRPSDGGCPYNAMMFKGMYQDNNGMPSYTMRFEGENSFTFASEPFEKIVINNMIMTTQPKSRDLFSFAGNIRFTQKDIDVYSFDSLAFSSAKIIMDFEDAEKVVFFSDFSSLTFDMGHSETRGNSLAKEFFLLPELIVNGGENSPPSRMGYVPVRADFLINTDFTAPWYGLRFAVVLGTTGTLSGNGAMSAKILLAWDGTGKTFTGIALPGAVMIENVLGLSTGAAKMEYDDGKKFSIVLSNISLKCFGLLKLPPSGALSLDLFGGIGWFALYKKE
jgi:hypothetical protein